MKARVLTSGRRRRLRPHGATMLEVLVAGGVLVLGLTGILQLILVGMGRVRNGDVQEESQVIAQSTLAEFKGWAFADVADAGVGTFALTDHVDDVGRTFSREATITDVNDGGLGAMRVEVRVRWNQRLGVVEVNRESTAALIISETPDANF